MILFGIINDNVENSPELIGKFIAKALALAIVPRGSRLHVVMNLRPDNEPARHFSRERNLA